MFAVGAMWWNAKAKREEPITAVYDYRDEGGEVIVRVARTEIIAGGRKEKNFPVHYRDPSDGKWYVGKGPRKDLLYMLPEMLREKAAGETIYIVEGERKHTKLVINTPKTKNSCREIPMNKELLAMVKPLKKVVNTDFYVLTNEEKPTEPRTYRNYYHRLMAHLDIPRLKYHGLRHSFATRCIESNCDYKTVSVLLGHANITTTLNLYVHPNMEQKKKCITKMFKSLGK